VSNFSVTLSIMVKSRKATTQAPEPSPKLVDISEEEQWRLVNETGILKKAIPTANVATVEEDTPLAEEIFGAVALIIPFSFLLLLFDMCVFPSIC